MTTTKQPRRKVYATDGVTLSFGFDKKLLRGEDLRVTLRSSAGVRTLLVQGQDYTVAGAGSSWTVTLVSPPAAGGKVALTAIPRLEQPLDLTQSEDAPLEDALDRITLDVAALDDAVGRALLAPEDYEGAPLVLPPYEANKALAVGPSGGLVNIDAGGGTVVTPPTRHGDLLDLALDQHPQYFNESRLVARLPSYPVTGLQYMPGGAIQAGGVLAANASGTAFEYLTGRILRPGKLGVTRHATGGDATITTNYNDTVFVVSTDETAESPPDLDDDITLTIANTWPTGTRKTIWRLVDGAGIVRVTGFADGRIRTLKAGDWLTVEQDGALGVVCTQHQVAPVLQLPPDGKLDAVDGDATRPILRSPQYGYGDHAFAAGVLDLDLARGHVFKYGGPANVSSVTWRNRPSTNQGLCKILVIFEQVATGTPFTVTFGLNFRFPAGVAWTMPSGYRRRALLEFIEDGTGWMCSSTPIELLPLVAAAFTAEDLTVSQTVSTTIDYDVVGLGVGGVPPYTLTAVSGTGGTWSISSGKARLAAGGAAGSYSATITLTDAAGATATGTIVMTLTASSGTLAAAAATRGGSGQTPVFNNDAMYPSNADGWDLVALGSGGTPPYTLTAFSVPAGTASISGGKARWTGPGVAAGTYVGSYTITDAVSATASNSFTLVVTAASGINNPAKPYVGRGFGLGFPPATFGDRSLPRDDYIFAPRGGRIAKLHMPLRVGTGYSTGDMTQCWVGVKLYRVSGNVLLAETPLTRVTDTPLSSSTKAINKVVTLDTGSNDVVFDEALRLEWRCYNSAGSLQTTNRPSMNGWWQQSWLGSAPTLPWATGSRWYFDHVTGSEDSAGEDWWKPMIFLHYSDGSICGMPYPYFEIKNGNEQVVDLSSTQRGRWTWTQETTESARALWAGMWSYGSGSTPAGNVTFRFCNVNADNSDGSDILTVTKPMSAWPRYASQWGWKQGTSSTTTSPPMEMAEVVFPSRQTFTAGVRYRCEVTAPTGGIMTFGGTASTREDYSGLPYVRESWPPGTRTQRFINGAWTNFMIEGSLRDKVQPWMWLDCQS